MATVGRRKARARARGGKRKGSQERKVDQTLYMCTMELKNDFKNRYTIHSIKLTDLLRAKEKEKEPEGCGLQTVFSIHNRTVPRSMRCGVLGSQLLLAGGLDFSSKSGDKSNNIYRFETDPTVDPDPTLKKFSPPFLQGKRDPFLVVLKGDLYALCAVDCGTPNFEVFNRKTKLWYPKREPPFYEESWGWYIQDLSCATAGTKILVSTFKSPKKVFCYDVAKYRPNELGEWEIFSGSDFENGLPFKVGNALVLDLEDGTNDYILFTYQFFFSCSRNDEDRGIVPYRMSINDSDSCISIKPIKTKSLRRAPVPPECLDATVTHSFVHLGGRKVCCVIARQVSPNGGSPISQNGSWCTIHKLRIVVITFEFQFTTKSNDADEELPVKNLATHTFEHECSKESEANSTYFASLIGCFLRY